MVTANSLLAHCGGLRKGWTLITAQIHAPGFPARFPFPPENFKIISGRRQWNVRFKPVCRCEPRYQLRPVCFHLHPVLPSPTAAQLGHARLKRSDDFSSDSGNFLNSITNLFPLRLETGSPCDGSV